MHRFEGNGVYAFATDTIYQGKFRDGMFHGPGTLYFPNGSKYEGLWENGAAVSVSVISHTTILFKTFKYLKFSPAKTVVVVL